MKAIERIYQYIDFKGIKIAEFERKNFLSNGYLKKMLLRKGDLGESILNQIVENSPEISAEWLLTGKGEMLKSDSTEVKKEVISSAEERVDRLLSIIESQQEVIKNLSEALIEADAQKECDAECADVG